MAPDALANTQAQTLFSQNKNKKKEETKHEHKKKKTPMEKCSNSVGQIFLRWL